MNLSSPIYERITTELDQRRQVGLLRCLPYNDIAPVEIDLSTNSYLALHCNSVVRQQALELAAGDIAGNLASRLIADRSPLYAELERELALWEGAEAALIFSSGYTANVGTLQALCTRDTVVFCDRLNHASIIDGILLSGARMIRYRHCDVLDLDQRLAACKAPEKIVVTDAVFSMDGDCAPLCDICELACRYGALVMVDEAHATGIFGTRQCGLTEATGVESEVDIRIGTLSKAVAGMGGFFVGSSLLRSYIINRARSLIYSTGLPPAIVAHNLAAVRYIRSTQSLGKRLLEMAAAFRHQVQEMGFNTGVSTTQIVPLITGSVDGALSLSQVLAKAGIRAPAIRPPTVPPNSARVRLSLHLGLTDNELRKVLQVLEAWKRSA